MNSLHAWFSCLLLLRSNAQLAFSNIIISVCYLKHFIPSVVHALKYPQLTTWRLSQPLFLGKSTCLFEKLEWPDLHDVKWNFCCLSQKPSMRGSIIVVKGCKGTEIIHFRGTMDSKAELWLFIWRHDTFIVISSQWAHCTSVTRSLSSCEIEIKPVN